MNELWDKILFEAKAVEKLSDAHVKQVLNYLTPTPAILTDIERGGFTFLYT
jgi:hypothetical protein